MNKFRGDEMESEFISIELSIPAINRRGQLINKFLVILSDIVILSIDDKESSADHTWIPNTKLKCDDVIASFKETIIKSIICPKDAIGVIASKDSGRYVKIIYNSNSSTGLSVAVFKKFKDESSFKTLLDDDLELGYNVLLLNEYKSLSFIKNGI